MRLWVGGVRCRYDLSISGDVIYNNNNNNNNTKFIKSHYAVGRQQRSRDT